MKKRTVRIIHEGKYAAEVPVELIEEEGGWSPYLSFDDAARIADVQAALRRGDVAAAAKLARVFELLPLTA